MNRDIVKAYHDFFVDMVKTLSDEDFEALLFEEDGLISMLAEKYEGKEVPKLRVFDS